MRAVVVHDAFVQAGGGERVAVQLAAALDAPVYTAAFRPAAVPADLPAGALHASAVQFWVRRGLPLTLLAPALPAAFAHLDLGTAEVVVSSSAAFAHHVQIPVGAVHVCYCHTPPRFLWEPDDYFRGQPLARVLLGPALAAFRRLDLVASRRVDVYVANSRHVAAKVRRAYGRDAVVVHPPTDTAAFRPTTDRSGRFLVVSRLKNQKQVDLAVRAANLGALPLDVIGDGPEIDRLRRLAGPTVRLLGRRPDEEVRAAMARAIGVVVPAVQDFGLTIVEAQASGRPPIAFGRGGALEIVEDGRTGFLFGEQTAAALRAAMERARRTPVAVDALVESARRFDVATFRGAIGRAIEAALAAQEPASPERRAAAERLSRPPRLARSSRGPSTLVGGPDGSPHHAG